jgi:hypothetical protein|tara:strand:- start:2915 stop:3208 length:294 start_codon:yes stop_codon:yes gene_type:complete
MQNNMALECFRRILLSTVLLTASLALSQTFDNPDAEPELEPIESIDSEASVEVEAETEQEPQEIVVDVSVIEQGNFDSFVPSEDISEDYSVPFPVDI